MLYASRSEPRRATLGAFFHVSLRLLSGLARRSAYHLLMRLPSSYKNQSSALPNRSGCCLRWSGCFGSLGAQRLCYRYGGWLTSTCFACFENDPYVLASGRRSQAINPLPNPFSKLVMTCGFGALAHGSRTDRDSIARRVRTASYPVTLIPTSRTASSTAVLAEISMR